MEIPTKTALGRFLDQNPHEARVSKRDRERESTEQTRETRQERESNSDEKRDKTEKDSET